MGSGLNKEKTEKIIDFKLKNVTYVIIDI